MKEFNLDRPFKTLVLFLQPTTYTFPWTGLDHETVAFMDFAVELQFLIQTNQLNLANRIDFLQKSFGIRYLQDFVDGIREEEIVQLEFRHPHENIGREHRPQNLMPIMVKLPFLVVVLDLPEFPQRQVVDEAVFTAVVHEFEFMERMGMDRPHLFVLARRQNPVVEIRYGNRFFHYISSTTIAALRRLWLMILEQPQNTQNSSTLVFIRVNSWFYSQKKTKAHASPRRKTSSGAKNKNRLQIRQINDLQTAVGLCKKSPDAENHFRGQGSRTALI